jgi:hypothetical protein
MASTFIHLRLRVGLTPSDDADPNNDEQQTSDAPDEERMRRWFQRTFPTNLAALDSWYTEYCGEIPFSPF